MEVLQGGIPETNEKQLVKIPSPVVSGGTFTLTFQGATTAGIAYYAAASAVETALEGLSGIAVGNVIVTGDLANGWTVEFDQNYGGINVPALVGDGTNLTGAGQVSIHTTQEGADAAAEIQLIDYSGGRIDPAENEYITIIDPINGKSQVLSFGLNWTAGNWQNVFNNAIRFLGNGGIAFTDLDADAKQLTVTFGGTWHGLNIQQMQPTNFTPGVSTIQDGRPMGRTRSNASRFYGDRRVARLR